MKPKLYPFQKTGVQKLEAFDGIALLADDMGLGKTIQAYTYAYNHPEARPIIVVCPASLKTQWAEEGKKWYGFSSVILSGQKPVIYPSYRKKDVVIINYDILKKWLPFLASLKAGIVILDEIHMVSGINSQRTKNCTYLCKAVDKRLGLSGSPMLSRPWELYPILHILRPDIWDSPFSFGMEYCEGEFDGEWKFKGAENLDKLHAQLRKHCFPWDTLVESELGQLPIGLIVDLELPIKVLTYATETACISWKQIRAYTRRASPSRLVRIQHQTGEVHCTPDHQIWTQAGYKRAKEIVSGDQLCVVLQQNSDFESDQQSPILQREMCSRAQSLTRRSTKENDGKAVGPYLQHRNKELQVVWDAIDRIDDKQAEVLLDKLRRFITREKCTIQKQTQSQEHYTAEEVQMVRKGDDQKGSTRSASQKEELHSVLQFTLFGNVSLVQDKNHRSYCERMENITMAETAAHSTKLAIEVAGSSYPNTEVNRKISEREALLSDVGPHTTRSEISNRSGWTNAPQQDPTISGQMESVPTEASRVELVAIYERCHRPGLEWSDAGDSVYDIEVEENHNFFANNILVHNCMIRRTKAEVLPDLPPKMRFIVPMEIEKPEEYMHAEMDLISWLSTYDIVKAQRAQRALRFVKFGYLKRLAAKLKMKMVLDWVDNYLKSTDRKLVVGAIHRKNWPSTIPLFEERYADRAVSIHGGKNSTERNEAKARFNEDPTCRMIVLQTLAGGVGLNLQGKGRDVALVELPWAPGHIKQLIDRTHRIGTLDTVNVYFLIAWATIEKRLCELLQNKQEVSDRILEGKIKTDESLSIFDELTLVMSKGEKS